VVLEMKAPQSRALNIVRKFFPGVTRVNDGDNRIAVEVTVRDSNKSVALDHRHCALAIACKRSQHADGVIIGTKTAYIIKGKIATRYELLESTAREIVSFDRKAGFAPGLYDLVPPGKGRRLGEGQTGRTHNESTRKVRMKHYTAGIRTMLNRQAR
jgi:hypothetical protein